LSAERSLPLDAEGARVAAFRAWATADARVAGPRGVEELVIGATLGAPRSTWLFPGQRERGCAILRGADPDRLGATRPYRVVPPGSSPVARAGFAVGAALAGEAALVFLGMGSTSYGGFHEAVHLAVQKRLPVTFVVSWYEAPGAPFAMPMAIDAATLAERLGVVGARVDGRDASAVRAAVAAANGTTVIQAVVG
jgi:TPP-dependent pyruvate/acetoin dehydrogenase alpha subunit